jgi:hypothetical protein
MPQRALADWDGRVLAEEERYSHVKHAWNTLPIEAVAFCLRHAETGGAAPASPAL